MELDIIRKQIDQVDHKIVALFEERMKLGAEVASFKKGTGKPIYDKQREDEKIADLTRYASNEFNKKAIEELFLQLMSINRKYQYSLIGDSEKFIENQFESVDKLFVDEHTKVAYQGVPGAYSEQCAMQFFGEEVNRFHVKEFKDIMEVLEQGKADYGVLPIENSSAGTVSGIYELLSQYDDLCIVGEEIVRVEHALLGIKGAKKEDIKEVYSHPQGLLQCTKYLEKYPWKQVKVSNTAVAASKVSNDHDKSEAAIASERAAEIYQLEIIERKINYESQNSTRFIILTKGKKFCKNAVKVSISFSLPHESGTLYNMLSNFIYNDLSMTNIESRPLPHRQWEYRFFVDFLGNLNDSSVQNALKAVREEAIDFKIIGNF